MITYQDIKKANDTIHTMPIVRRDKSGKEIKKEYAEVNQRIKAFRMVYPNGKITTNIISIENDEVLMQAEVCNDEGMIIATGYAQENKSSSLVNKTSFIENCETSAVGRALGMCGFGIDVSVASYEEVKNAMDQQNTVNNKPAAKEKTNREKVISLCKSMDINMTDIARKYGLSGKSTDDDFYDVLGDLEEEYAKRNKGQE